MKRLEAVHLVQFSFFEADTFTTRGNLAFLGPNGVGKTSVLDAIQIAMLGAHRNFTAFNSQSVATRNKRKLKDYCLGVIRSDEFQAGSVRKRDHSHCYITLVFRDTKTGDAVSAGVCITASVLEDEHALRGLYVLPGVALSLEDHLEAVDGGNVPLDWAAFEVELQRRAKAVGRTPHVSVHPEAYVDELLHAIQPSAHHIDRRAFVRAFKKSMNLKDIESVNDFVRDHLVDSQRINKQTALTQINRFKELKALIEQTKEQIETLEKIQRDHQQLLNAYRKRDTLAAIKARFLVESTKTEAEELTAKSSAVRTVLAKLGPQIALLEERKRVLRVELEAAIELAAADPDVLASEQHRRLWEALTQRRAEYERALQRINLQARSALHQANATLPTMDAQVRSRIESVSKHWEHAAGENREADATLVKETKDLIASLKVQMAQAAEAAQDTHSLAETKLKSLLGQAKAAARGAGRLEEEVGVAIEIFREHGIDAEPVSALIEIKDRDWQAAVEAFLGRKRQSLVVAPGREREAVRLLRTYGKEADWLFQITIVQPEHLRSVVQSPTPGTVAALIGGTNDTAVRYVRQLFGNMRCVDSEEELEKYSRALTVDGMVSANGGTQRKKLPDSDTWLIGSKLSEHQKSELHRAVLDAQRHLEESRHAVTQVEKAADSIRQGLRDLDPTAYAETTNGLLKVRGDLTSVPDPSTLKEPERVIKLKARKVEIDQALVGLEGELEAYKRQSAERGALATEYERQLLAIRERLGTLEAQHQAATQAADYEEGLEPSLRDAITTGNEPAKWIAVTGDLIEDTETRIDHVKERVLPTFSQFLDRYNIVLFDERSDWRKAKGWVEARISHLKTSEIVSYEDEASAALQAAQETFRRDIAYKLREAIHRLEDNIHELNKILAACPAFSSNERYKFEAKPVKAYEKIYQFIVHVDDWEGATGSLIADRDDPRSEIIKLLEQTASDDPKRPLNPLEDYRLLYNFDLLILQDGTPPKEVDRLSRRMGVASNGEHRVPFYVIAGASLAAAYRLNANAKKDGAALMLLDEAFYGIDSQNSFAVAEFLRSLGLQLVMAGPEADKGKLAPMTHTLYEMDRHGTDVFYEAEHFTAAMHQLMVSDMPMLNPNLIDELEASLQRKSI